MDLLFFGQAFSIRCLKHSIHNRSSLSNSYWSQGGLRAIRLYLDHFRLIGLFWYGSTSGLDWVSDGTLVQKSSRPCLSSISSEEINLSSIKFIFYICFDVSENHTKMGEIWPWSSLNIYLVFFLALTFFLFWLITDNLNTYGQLKIFNWALVFTGYFSIRWMPFLTYAMVPPMFCKEWNKNLLYFFLYQMIDIMYDNACWV